MKISPNREQVKMIYREVYMLFVKYSDISTNIDFKLFLKESHDLNNKYPFELCEHQILDIANILDGYAREV